jgi:2'-5' RNA ligase
VLAALERAIGWEREGRRFRPHLTAGRLGGRRGAGGGPLDPTPAGRFTVDAVVLYRSFLDPAGARYEALARVPLV